MTQRLPADPLAGLLSLPRQLARTLGLPEMPSFGIEGLGGARSGLGYQSISVGAQNFESVRIIWTGQVTNTGNAPLSGANARLQVLQGANTVPVRESSVALSTLQPGASAPINLAVDILSTDSPGDFIGVVTVEVAGQRLGQMVSGVLGRINPLPAPKPVLNKFKVGDSVWTVDGQSGVVVIVMEGPPLVFAYAVRFPNGNSANYPESEISFTPFLTIRPAPEPPAPELSCPRTP